MSTGNASDSDSDSDCRYDDWHVDPPSANISINTASGSTQIHNNDTTILGQHHRFNKQNISQDAISDSSKASTLSKEDNGKGAVTDKDLCEQDNAVSTFTNLVCRQDD